MAADYWEQITDLTVEAFRIFDAAAGAHPVLGAIDRAPMMLTTAQTMATAELAREQRLTNLLAVAAAPADLQVDMALRQAAFQEAVTAMGLVEEPGPDVADLRAALGLDDPADKDTP